MAIRIQLRRDTAANWVSVNPTLRAGEIGIETDTLKFKIGNGSAWNSTSGYANVTPSGLTNSLGNYILLADQGTPGGPAELDSNGDLIIPENSIILWNDQAYDYTTTLTATEPTANRTITLPNNSGTIALTSDISAAVTSLVDAAPTALDTLNELAAALGDDANFASTVTTSIGTKAPIASPTFTGTVSGITKSMVGLGNVDNTTDANKPISTATQTALDLKANSSEITELAQDAVNTALIAGVALTKTYDDAANTITVDLDNTTVNAGSYGSTTKIPTFTVDQQGRLTAAGEANVATNLSIAGDTGTDTVNLLTDTVTVVGGAGITSAVTNNTVTLDIDSTVATLTGTQTLTNKTLTSPAISLPTGIIKSDVGLGNVDNTTDANKPISTATQTALDLKAPLASPTFTGTVTLPGAPTLSLHAATKQYVDGLAAGINFHQPVVAATAGNLAGTYSNGVDGFGATLTKASNGSIGTIDNATVAVGNRILLRAQTDPKENGIYTITSVGGTTSPWIITRAADADNNPAGELANGDFCFVTGGTTNGSKGFLVSTVGTITIGTTEIQYAQFNASEAIIAGSGITKTGATISIESEAITSGMIANGAIVDADINASAAIAQSKISGLAQSLALKADLDSPTFTGVPSLPFGTLAVTQAADDDSNKIATTAYVFDAAAVVATNAAGLVTGHAALTEAHGAQGAIVGQTNTQTLTNKTIDAASNTLVGVVLLNSTDTLTNKTINVTNNELIGVVLPNSTEELTNKTINAASNTLVGIVTLTGTQTLTNKTIDPLTNNLPGVVTLTGTQTLTNKTLTNPTITGVNFGTAPISVVTPTEDGHAVNRAYVTAALSDAVGSDILPIDDISDEFDGSQSRFQLKYDGENFTPSNPYKLLITINGILQVLGNQSTHWLSPIQSEGYLFDNDGFVQFGEPVPVGSKFEARYMSGPNNQTAKKSLYPFRAVDIQLGE
jgi:hypothetical protein